MSKKERVKEARLTLLDKSVGIALIFFAYPYLDDLSFHFIAVTAIGVFLAFPCKTVLSFKIPRVIAFILYFMGGYLLKMLMDVPPFIV